MLQASRSLTARSIALRSTIATRLYDIVRRIVGSVLGGSYESARISDLIPSMWNVASSILVCKLVTPGYYPETAQTMRVSVLSRTSVCDFDLTMRQPASSITENR